MSRSTEPDAERRRLAEAKAGTARPVFGSDEGIQTDPDWRDHILFYEYFNGDTGAGLGASHQTGWTGLVAKLLERDGRARMADR